MYESVVLLPLILYIIIIYYVLYKNIKNSNLTFILIISTVIYIISMRYYRKQYMIKNNINPDELDNKECIIGSCKKFKGLMSNGCLDVWHLYHMLFWILFGILYPNKYILILFISITWEVSEHIYGNCFRIEDIFINMISYIIGSYIANNRNKIQKYL